MVTGQTILSHESRMKVFPSFAKMPEFDPEREHVIGLSALR
jgi:hypothetical protein